MDAPIRHRRAVAYVLLLIALQWGCGRGERPPAPSADIQALFLPDTSAGAADAIGEVAAARFTASGNAIVVLDGYPPFIKILNREGRLLHSFAPEGGGPGELKKPYSLAVQGDSVIGVLSANGLSEFSLNGDFLRSRPALPVRAIGISDYCGDGWLIYGPKHISAPRQSEENPWLIGLEGAADSTPRVVYADSVVPEHYSLYAQTQISAGGGGFAFIREEPLPRAIFSGDCRTGKVAEVVHRLEYAGPDRIEKGGGNSVRRVMAPGPRPFGIGITSNGVLLARRPAGRGFPTVLNMIGSPDSVVVQVEEGSVRLQDARPGIGALFSTQHPWPRVIVVPESQLLASFGREAGSPERGMSNGG